jgi:hypothetical protein
MLHERRSLVLLQGYPIKGMFTKVYNMYDSMI